MVLLDILDVFLRLLRQYPIYTIVMVVGVVIIVVWFILVEIGFKKHQDDPIWTLRDMGFFCGDDNKKETED